MMCDIVLVIYMWLNMYTYFYTSLIYDLFEPCYDPRQHFSFYANT
jgi:hypothetical protein